MMLSVGSERDCSSAGRLTWGCFVAPCCWFFREPLLQAEDSVLQLGFVLLQGLHSWAQRLCHGTLPTQQGNLAQGMRTEQYIQLGHRKLHSKITPASSLATGNLCQQSELPTTRFRFKLALVGKLIPSVHHACIYMCPLNDSLINRTRPLHTSHQNWDKSHDLRLNQGQGNITSFRSVSNSLSLSIFKALELSLWKEGKCLRRCPSNTHEPLSHCSAEAVHH